MSLKYPDKFGQEVIQTVLLKTSSSIIPFSKVAATTPQPTGPFKGVFTWKFQKATNVKMSHKSSDDVKFRAWAKAQDPKKLKNECFSKFRI